MCASRRAGRANNALTAFPPVDCLFASFCCSRSSIFFVDTLCHDFLGRNRDSIQFILVPFSSFFFWLLELIPFRLLDNLIFFIVSVDIYIGWVMYVAYHIIGYCEFVLQCTRNIRSISVSPYFCMRSVRIIKNTTRLFLLLYKVRTVPFYRK